ncbi:MAG: D-2-hydroxyacid dehydrogenase [Clostridia bacterium]
MRILASDGMDKSAIKKLTEKGHEVVEQFYEVEDLKEQVKKYDVLVVRSATKVREPVIDAAVEGGKLKMIIRGGVGIDNIDAQYAEEKGIRVRNTPKASSDTVAELALAHMFSAARFINIAGHTMREGKWEKKEYKGIELMGKVLGIIGYGRIGQALGRRAIALGMKVVAYDIYQIPELENENMHYVEMDELLRTSDFISLHTPGPKGNPAIVNKTSIEKMKDGVIIINTSRGNTVDEAALLEGLNSGKVRAVGLDVFNEEPAKNAALYSHPHVSCTPHIGASTAEAQKRIGNEIVEIIENM